VYLEGPAQKNNYFQSVSLLLGVSLLPVYVFASGGMQPSHFFLAVFFVVTLFSKGFKADLLFLFFGFFVAYVFFVEGMYCIFGYDYKYLINGFFYLYNLLFYLAVMRHVEDYGVKVILVGVGIASLIALFTVMSKGVSFQVGSEAGRSVGSFNNPNQLGYFSVCILSLGYLFYRLGEIKYWQAFFFFLVAMFFSVVSLSKAAMISNFIVALIAVKPFSGSSAGNFKSFLVALVWMFIGFLAVVSLVLFFYSSGGQDYIFVQRIQGMAEESDSSLAARGYFAFLEGDWFELLFGLGSHQVYDLVGHEVHSTIGSVFNSYGFIGSALFLSFFMIWFVRLYRAFGMSGLVCVAGPAMLYGITHNGARFVVFWLLFSLSMAVSYSYRARN